MRADWADRAVKIVLAAWLLVALAPLPGAGGGNFTVAPPPAWVQPLAAGPDPGGGPRDAGRPISYLLVDEQTRVTGRSTERYSHYAKKVLSTTGIESGSQVEVEFEPSYQRLTLHHIRLLRGGRAINALNPREVRVIEHEDEREQQLFNGTLSAVVILSDVRVGDVIDYAYSILGDNPILGGKFVDTLYLGWPQPVSRLRHRLLMPEGRRLHWRGHQLDLPPATRPLGGEVEYTWERASTAPVESEVAAPGWFDPTPRVEVSEFADWGEVVGWALPLYRAGAPPGSELAAQIERWRADLAGPEARLLAALRFVQDEVRYLGIEMGPHSHLPHPPAQVFNRRFGDCKDKSLLLVTALNALGVEAHVALVDTKARRQLDQVQPSPFAFDHVIVRARLGGTTYWLDPTETLQRGGLPEFYTADFERGLVVREGTRGLEEIPPTPAPAPTLAVKEIFRLESAGGPAALEVMTTYRGIDADAVRAELAEQPLADLAKDYLDDYASLDPAITAEKLPEVSDDPVANTIVIREQYLLPSFGKKPSRRLIPDRIIESLKAPRLSRRSSPLVIPHPVHVSQTIEIRLPEPASIDASAGRVRHDAFDFEYRHGSSGGTILLDYRLQTLRDYIPAEQVASYLEAVEQVKDQGGYELRVGKARGGMPVFSAATLLGGSLGLALVGVGTVTALRRARARRRRGHEYGTEPG